MKRRFAALPSLAFRTASNGGGMLAGAGAQLVIGMARSVIGRIGEALDRRATARALAALDDRQLRDIGFNRREIDELLLMGRFPKRHQTSKPLAKLDRADHTSVPVLRIRALAALALVALVAACTGSPFEKRPVCIKPHGGANSQLAPSYQCEVEMDGRRWVDR